MTNRAAQAARFRNMRPVDSTARCQVRTFFILMLFLSLLTVASCAATPADPEDVPATHYRVILDYDS